ncbi:unnamed protein product, partial [Brenthis ino]
MYSCTPGDPGFESQVGPSLVIESSCIVSLSNSPELGSWRCFTPVPQRAQPATDAFFFVVPEDVAMGFTAYYGFAPRIVKGNDHRVGFGFRFGNHADFQILYEFGPQITTKPLESKRLPRQREVRRPILEFLLRTGILKRATYQYNTVNSTESSKETDIILNSI